MKTQITWERPLPDTILGEKIVVHTVYSSFDRAEIDKLQEECERRIGYALVGELSAVCERQTGEWKFAIDNFDYCPHCGARMTNKVKPWFERKESE